MELHRIMRIKPDAHVIALAGGGGKTTSLYGLSRESAAAGRRTVLMTTTHIGVPRKNDIDLYTEADENSLHQTWASGRIAAVGKIGEDGRLISPDADTYELVCREAEAIYIEADGSKCLPLKYPDRHEPAIPDNTDQVLVICGLSALDKPFDEFCHRAALARQKLGITAETIDEMIMAQVISAGYGSFKPVIIINQADTMELRRRGEHLAKLLSETGAELSSVVSLHQLLGINGGVNEKLRA
jgi:probable selenium-dependent hydroxylase accessory protein YqeC